MNEWVSKDGRVRLIQGDALEALSDLKVGEKITSVITDPPYLVGAVSIGNSRAKSGTWADLNNASYWFSAWYAKCWNLLPSTGHFATFCNWRSLPLVICSMAQADMQATSCLIWNKDWIGPAAPNALRPTYEMVVMASKPEATIPDRSASDLWTSKWMAAHSGDTGHPAEKPVDLIGRIIKTLGSKVILDPFMGSGTCGVAAVKLGCSFIGIEIDRAHFETAKARIERAITDKANELPLTFDEPQQAELFTTEG